ncbi:hypothetical protein BON88_01435, partial [Escherichia coli]
GTVCVVGKIRDLILQLSKSSIYSTKPLWDYGYGAFWPEPGWGAPYYTNAVSQVTPELVK